MGDRGAGARAGLAGESPSCPGAPRITYLQPEAAVITTPIIKL